MSEAAGDPPLFFQKHIFMCTNRRKPGHPRGCCAENDAEDIRNYMKAKAKQLGIENIRINSAGCLDRCEIGPNVLIYPEGVWYRCASFEDADEILQIHVIEGGRVGRLMHQPEDGPGKG